MTDRQSDKLTKRQRQKHPYLESGEVTHMRTYIRACKEIKRNRRADGKTDKQKDKQTNRLIGTQ